MRKKVEELDILATAYLYGQQQTQETIGRSLGLSQPMVSRLVLRAKQQGYLETRTRFVEDRVTKEDLARIQARVRPAPLKEILSKVAAEGSKLPGPVVHVYPSHSRNTSSAAWRHRVDEFASACVDDVLKVLASATVIGVSWGDTVASAIDAMKRVAPAVQRDKRTRTAVPLLGEPLGLNITQHSSSVLAARLEEALNPGVEPGQGHSLSLAAVPALIPAEMSEPEIVAIHKLINLITAYREIFGAKRRKAAGVEMSVPWIDRIDAVLTSTSTHERPLGFDDDSLIRTAGVERTKLNDLVIGDLCGALIPRPDLNEKALGEVKSILRRWTGVKIKQLENCAARARDSDAPGVIVLAIGASKAQVVHAAVRRGLIQHLFMDQDLADRLEQICVAPDRTP
jgi:DNA-binding transcriptional regulator LsrR (DeoR family)